MTECLWPDGRIMMIFLQGLPTVPQYPFEELMFFLTYDLESRNFSPDCCSNVYSLSFLLAIIQIIDVFHSVPRQLVGMYSLPEKKRMQNVWKA